MSLLFYVVYNVIRVPLFFTAKIVGLFNAKVGETIKGRKGLFASLAGQMAVIPADAPRLWIHASSMGEYEQALPLVNELLERRPNAWVVLTLFSPSVYKHIKATAERTIAIYLPFDSPVNVKRFIRLVKPSVHVIIRHDIWPNYQWRLRRGNIPSILADASISDKRLKSANTFKRLYRQVYYTFSAICAVSDVNAERIKVVFPRPGDIHVCGDTRYDRVRERARDTTRIERLQKSGAFVHRRCLVVGSSWPEDEAVIFPAIAKALQQFEDFSVIIAPHEITTEHLKSIEKFFADNGTSLLRLSRFEKEGDAFFRVLVVDRIGLLANLYALGGIAYVGGAFGVGVHSVLEPAAHGVWVSFGPRHLNSPEAKEMAKTVGAPVATAEEFERFLMKALKDPEYAARQGQLTLDYMRENFGASSKTADVIEKYLS